MILASAEAVKKYGLKPRAKVLGMASGGVAPRIMGVGPVPAAVSYTHLDVYKRQAST